MDTTEPIWITGVGAATPLGCDLAEIESNLLAGRSGVSLVTRFPTDDYPEPDRRAARGGPLSAGMRVRSAFAARPRWTSSPTVCARRPCATPGSGARIARRGLAWCWGSGPSGCCSGRPTISRGGSRLYDPEQDRDSTIERVRRELELSGPALASRPPAPAATTRWRSAGTGCGSAWSTSAWRGPATWPSRRSAWRPSATFGAVAAELRSVRRVAALRPRPRRLRAGRGRRRVRPGAVRRRPPAARPTPTPRSPAAGPAATPTTT